MASMMKKFTSRTVAVGMSAAFLGAGFGIAPATAYEPGYVHTLPEVLLHTGQTTHELEAYEYVWGKSGIEFGSPGDNLPVLSGSETAKITVEGIDDADVVVRLTPISDDAVAPCFTYDMVARGNDVYEVTPTDSLVPAEFDGTFQVDLEVRDGSYNAYLSFVWEV